MRETIALFAAKVYMFLLPFSWLALAISIFVLVPLAFFRKTRPAAGLGLFIASWLFGLTTWTLGVTITFLAYGWVGLIIGLLLFGVGVVPMGIFAAFFNIKSVSLGFSMIVMLIVIYVARGAGAALIGQADEIP